MKDIEETRVMVDRIKLELPKLPEGALRCTSSNGTSQYWVDGKYTSKKKISYVKALAQRDYYEKVLPLLENNMEKLQELDNLIMKNKIEECYNNCCSARQILIDPVVYPNEMLEKKFMNQVYEPGTFSEDNTTEFYTLKGERVRSKSELIIADELYRNKIPYHYEKPLYLDDWGKEVSFRPDFTILNKRTGKVLLYEHFGKMDEEKYVNNAMGKIRVYERNGYIIGKNLLLTFETSRMPLSSSTISMLIKEFYT